MYMLCTMHSTYAICSWHTRLIVYNVYTAAGEPEKNYLAGKRCEVQTSKYIIVSVGAMCEAANSFCDCLGSRFRESFATPALISWQWGIAPERPNPLKTNLLSDAIEGIIDSFPFALWYMRAATFSTGGHSDKVTMGSLSVNWSYLSTCITIVY